MECEDFKLGRSSISTVKILDTTPNTMSAWFSVRIETMPRKQESVLLVCISTTILFYNLIGFETQWPAVQVGQEAKVIWNRKNILKELLSELITMPIFLMIVIKMMTDMMVTVAIWPKWPVLVCKIQFELFLMIWEIQIFEDREEVMRKRCDGAFGACNDI